MTDTSYVPKRLPILKWPDPRLHEKSRDIVVFDETIRNLSADLFHTMKTADGVGIAAPQTGNMVNMIAVWVDQPLCFINPRIIGTSDDTFRVKEGCLSVPGYYEERSRSSHIVVEFQDIEGNAHRQPLAELLAFVVQHEIDHLHGKVFVDELSVLKKERVKRKIEKTIKNR